MVSKYPLFPVFSFIGAFLVLLVLSARRSLNFCVTMLCTSIVLGNVIYGVNAVLWADSAEIKSFLWCDIVTHLQVFLDISKPACSVAIARQLYFVVAHSSVEHERQHNRSREILLNTTLCVIWPAICASVLYYIVQDHRFIVISGQGCLNTVWPSGASIILFNSWPIIFPLVSIVFYCPCTLWALYRHSQMLKRFLSLHSPSAYSSHVHIIALSCLDILFMLPCGIVSLVFYLRTSANTGMPLTFYPGWGDVHASWAPVAYELDQDSGPLWCSWAADFKRWVNVTLSIVMFALFGISTDARKTYVVWARLFARLCGWRIEQPLPPISEPIAFRDFGSERIANGSVPEHRFAV